MVPIIPFHDGKEALPYEKFCGRNDLVEAFRSFLNPLAPNRPRSFVWIIEGRRNFGKSCFGTWCEEQARPLTGQGANQILATPGSARTDYRAIVSYMNLPKRLDQSTKAIDEKEFRKVLFEQLWKHVCMRSGWEKYRRIGHKLIKPIHFIGDLATRFFSFGTLSLPPIEQKFAQTPEHFLAIVRRWAKAVRKNVSTMVLIFDEIPPAKEIGAEAQIWKLAKSIATAAATWPNDFPVIGFIILPLPGWDQPPRFDYATTPGRLIDKREYLKAFSPAETAQLVDKSCSQSSFRYSDAFVERLHFLSGGIPNLVQRIGYCACGICLKDNPDLSSFTLEDKHANQAVQQPEIRDLTAESVRSWDLTLNDLHGENSSVLKELVNGIASLKEATVKGGLTEKNWRDTILTWHSAAQYQLIYKKLWTKLCDYHVILSIEDSDPTLFGFCAEAIRIHLESLVPTS
jgi:hypothetical protein